MEGRLLRSLGLLVALPAASFAANSTAVADAAMNHDLPGLRVLINQKADVNGPQADGNTALHWAAQWNNLEAADLLIRAGANPMAATRLGATPLYLASEAGSAAMISKLLAAGADPNATFLTHGETPLMFAARSGSVDSVRVLLDSGAKLEAQDTLRGTTALIWAAEQNHPALVRLLLARGADAKAHSTVVIPAARAGRGGRGGGRGGATPPAGRGPAADAGAADPPPPPVVPTGGLTPLIFAAREGFLETATALLNGGAPIDQASADGSTALLVAIQNGKPDVARLLVDRGADVNLSNTRGWNPLYIAVKNRTIETGGMPLPTGEGMFELIKMLVDKGASVNARLKADTEVRNDFRAIWLQEEGATPFLRAAFTGDLEVMKLLLAHGADPKIPTSDGTTALMALAGIGFADGFIHDYGGPQQSLEAMKLLLDLGLDPNAKNQDEMTALHGAANKNFVGALQLLVDRGADLTAASKGNIKSNFHPITVLDYAEGVQVAIGPSAIYHADAVALVEKLMGERNLPLPASIRPTKGGKADQGLKQ
jgi:ankyrin repeat protein